MGTLSKRPLRDFGIDVRDRLEGFRSSVGSKVDQLHDRVEAEGPRGRAVTEAVDKLAASLPPAAWLGIAGASLVGAVALKAVGRSYLSLLVGQWAPAFLVLGLYSSKLASTSHVAEFRGR